MPAPAKTSPDTLWVPLPLNPAEDGNCDLLTMPLGSAQTMQDFYADNAPGGTPGTLRLRGAHYRIFPHDHDPLPASHPVVKAVAEVDGFTTGAERAIMALGRDIDDDTHYALCYIRDLQSGAWTALSGLDAGKGSVSIVKDERAIRVFGEDLGWYGKLTYWAATYTSGGVTQLKKFNATTGPNVSDIVARDNSLPFSDAGFTFGVTAVNVGAGHFPADSTQYYFLTAVYEGGEETLPLYIGFIHNGSTFDARVSIQVISIAAFPSSIKILRLYRRNRPYPAVGVYPVNDMEQVNIWSGDIDFPVLDFPIYDMTGDGTFTDPTSWHYWTIVGDSTTKAVIDIGMIGPTYTDNTGVGLNYQSTIHTLYSPLTLSPPRRRCWLFPTFTAYADVTIDGIEEKEILYLDFTNEVGLMRDIVLASQNLGNIGVGEIYSLIENRGYKAFIGAKGVKICQIDSNDILRADMRQAVIPIGCIAEHTIQQTPFGPVFLGDGNALRLVQGSAVSPPLGREVLWELDAFDTADLVKCWGIYCPTTQNYYLFTPKDANNHTYLYVINLGTHACRREATGDDVVYSMCLGGDEFPILCGTEDIRRLDRMRGHIDPPGIGSGLVAEAPTWISRYYRAEDFNLPPHKLLKVHKVQLRYKSTVALKMSLQRWISVDKTTPGKETQIDDGTILAASSAKVLKTVGVKEDLSASEAFALKLFMAPPVSLVAVVDGGGGGNIGETGVAATTTIFELWIEVSLHETQAA